MKPELTPDQRRAVELSGADLCVVAGAGTGKTHVLTERVVRRVTSGQLDLSHLLAVTFTEKAAAEMKARLSRALLAAGHVTAREDVERAAISTVHAFCARLLREYAVEAGLDPRFVVLEEVEADRLLRDAVTALVRELWDAQAPELALLAGLGSSDPEATLRTIYRAARESVYEVARFAEVRPDLPDRRVLSETLLCAVEAVRAAQASGTEKAAEKARRLLDAAAALPGADGDVEELLPAVQAVSGATDLRCGAVLKQAMGEVRSAAQALLPVLAEEVTGPVRRVLGSVLVRLDDLYEEAKGRGERLDFTDLERAALRLLRSTDAVRTRVRDRWSEVLVDEFQDTNPVQEALVRELRSPGALFVVGDPKQAIYGFRGSDVEVFLRFQDEVRNEFPGGEVHLSRSFRARPELLGAVNRLFREGFSPGPSVTVPYEPLVAGRTFAPKDRPCTEMAVFAAQSTPEGRRTEADWVARRIVDLVAGRDPLELCTRDGDDALATRPASYGDVAILLRATTSVKVLERALTAHGVPYLVVKGRGFFQAREVVDLANLLTCVDDPSDDLTLAAVLKSPACGVTDDGLFVLTRARKRMDDGERGSLVDVLQGVASRGDLTEVDQERLERFVPTLSDLRSLRASASLSVLVDLALERTGLELLALARPGGRRRAANLRKVRALALMRDRSGEHGLRDLIREMRDLRMREARETEAPVAAAATGAVRIMTVHAAKGLEFPVVFVPDLGRSTVSSRGETAAHHTDGLGFKEPPGRADLAGVRTHSFATLRERQALRERAESDRLLYVAVTRAEEHLVLSTSLTPQGRARPWWDKVSAALDVDGSPQEREVRDLGPGSDDVGAARATLLVHGVAEQEPDPLGARSLLPGLAKDLAEGRLAVRDVCPQAESDARTLLAEAAREIPLAGGPLYTTTVSGLIEFGRDPEEFRRRFVLGLPESLDVLLPGDPGRRDGDEDRERPGDDDEVGLDLDARARGRAVHLALERLVPEFADDVWTVVEACLRTETGGAEPEAALVDDLTSWVTAFGDSPLGRQVHALPRDQVRREQSFLFQAGRATVRGQIDLVFRDEFGWSIVDYKAGEIDSERLERYTAQMRLYAYAVRAVTGETPQRLVLVSLPDGSHIDVPCTDDHLDELHGGLLTDFAATVY